ncbi:hypothetical protein, partial [Scytonema sp. UIC 10036]|uniref:WD40 repeat domain-containing protein n=1 Tax=Scytonema sp. UIC 10036 TaxID=2304196 RepID=UPI0012DA0661
MKTLSGHKHWVLGIAFHPNERILASASQDQTIRLWDILTGECQEILRSPRPYEGMNITGISGLSATQKNTLTAFNTFAKIEAQTNFAIFASYTNFCHKKTKISYLCVF